MGTKRATMIAERGTEDPGSGGLAEIHERSARAGFRLAYLLTGNRELAEDLVQEAFRGGSNAERYSR